MSQVPSTTYRRLFELAPTGMIMATPEGDILEANPAFLSMCSYTLEELQNRGAQSLYANPQQRKEVLRRLENESTVCNLEIQLLDREEKQRACLLTATGETNDQGQLQRILTIVQDITEYRQLQQEMLDIREQERRRIGRELHDGPASTLSGLSLIIHGLIDKLSRGQSIDPEDLRRVAEIVSHEAEETRTLSHELHVPELEDGTLLEALQTLQQSVEFIFGASCHLEIIEPPPCLPKKIALHLYRIAQEAAHNAGRHGEPQNIWIRLQSDEKIILSIEDDGGGLPRDISENQLGLHTIRYRAEVIGASYEIRSRPQNGTLISCRMPRERLEKSIS